MIFLVQLIETDGLVRINRIVNSDGYRYKGEADMTLPDGTHRRLTVVKERSNPKK
jgi:hypothetical protein